jgi:soluble lytic murein transglycosylase
MRIVMPRRSSAGFAAAVLLGFACHAFAQGTDADFLAAKTAFDRGDSSALAGLAPRLRTHVLQPYVDYWRLKLRIDTADAESIDAYLAAWPNTPLAERLRVDALKAAAKRADWSRFAVDYPPAAGEDVELACYGVQYRRQRDGDAALAAAKPSWFTGQATPEACEPIFAALIAAGTLTPADRLARFRLANEAGNVRLAQSLAVDLPPADRINPREFAGVDRDPVRALAKGEFHWNTRGGQELALYALERSARADPAGARAAWVKWRDKLPPEARGYGNGRLAFHAARQLNPDANAWFREAAGAPMNSEQQAWRVRAALRAQSWSDVLAAIDAMPAAMAQEPAWQYWRARALVANGRGNDAQPIYLALTSDYGFYGLLAAETLGRRVEPPSRPLPAPAAWLASFGARPEVKRVVKLSELGLRPEAVREWLFVVRGLDDDGLLMAADYAQRAGLPDRAINTADRTQARHDFALRYPLPWRAEFGAAARENDVEAALLYGIARQESRFVPDIVSSAGAVGMMQLMPGTARWVAKQLNRADFKPAQITNVDLNTQFGAYYFKYWLERLDRQPALAAAAYNAGPGRAQAWKPAAPLEGAAWVETIPFNETRDYVKKVLANSMHYTRALEGSPVTLTERLGTVAPRNGTATVAKAD